METKGNLRSNPSCGVILAVLSPLFISRYLSYRAESGAKLDDIDAAPPLSRAANSCKKSLGVRTCDEPVRHASDDGIPRSLGWELTDENVSVRRVRNLVHTANLRVCHSAQLKHNQPLLRLLDCSGFGSFCPLWPRASQGRRRSRADR